ncbi:MAG: sigma-54 dependent transcriptional regulator [Myxococcota bacterium]
MSKDRQPISPTVVLVVEPDELTRHRLRSALGRDDQLVFVAESRDDGLLLAKTHAPRIALVSLELPEGRGVLEAFGACCDRVVATGRAPKVAEVVDAMRRGATDVISVVDEAASVQRVVDRVLGDVDAASASPEGPLPITPTTTATSVQQLLSQSPSMIRVFDQVQAIALTHEAAFIKGEVGSGRQLICRAIHEKSPRRDHPFVVVHCGAYPDSLDEMLFGSAQGHPGALDGAEGGTLYLDEVHCAPHQVQAQLLRFLEDGTFCRPRRREPMARDVRVLVASDADLSAEVDAGRFRQDLYYRLQGFPIRIPPLRERPDDIPLLIHHFIAEIAGSYGLDAPIIDAEVLRAAVAFSWPGNVRQLRSLCAQWVIACPGQRIDAALLPRPRTPRRPEPKATSPFVIDATQSLKDNTQAVLREIETAYLREILQRCQGHLGQTATAAGITRRTLYTKMRQYGLEQQDFRRPRA